MDKTCSNCNKSFSDDAKFCNTCGKALEKDKSDESTKSINHIIIFYSSCLLFSLISFFITSEYPFSFSVELGVEICFALIVVIFSVTNFNEIKALYKYRKFHWGVYAFTIIFPIVSSLTVYFLLETLYSYSPDLEYINYYYEYAHYEHPFLWGFIFIAVLPPIFEELAFRGYLFNKLLKIASVKTTIIATAFIFAIIHFSLISFLWIFPFGLILGYLRSKYKTLWLGMIIHFIHNLIVLLLDYYQANYFS